MNANKIKLFQSPRVNGGSHFEVSPSTGKIPHKAQKIKSSAGSNRASAAAYVVRGIMIDIRE